ncbi:Sister chromatid cohesion protein pds5 [Coemansia asiatica]|nr:Sister chromatid cohesion protein pds5 [Coemansia asiatica]
MTEDGGPLGLSFQPKLFSDKSNKKTVTISELYKQLKVGSKLSKDLNNLEQETIDTHSLDSITRQLLAPALLKHKESGVVAYVTCCISDILRLYAPEAPYSDDEIKQIFNVFIDQLGHLDDPNNQFFPLREYLLTNLATVRTCALVTMLPDAEDVISKFFAVLFGIVKPGLAHSIQMLVQDVLQQLLEEPRSVPQDVIDIILLQFTRKRQQDNPVAHQLASDLAKATSDVLQKYIYQYFNDVIVSAAQQRVGQMQQQLQQQHADGEGQRQNRSSAATGSLEDLRSAHFLILELNKAAPGTLLNVIPQVEEELSVDDVDIRVLATDVLGEMFAEKGFTLAKRYESTWRTWKGRRADTSSLVRVQWVEHAVSLYQHQPQLSRELNEFVVEKLCDVDEKVRQATCRAFGQLEMTQMAQTAISESVVNMLVERCKDRKASVRSEAIVSLATIYSQVYEDIEQGSAPAKQKWGSIPSKIFMLRFIDDPEIDSKVESILTSAILNFSQLKDDRSRCQRLLFVFGGLSSKARTGFLSYMQRQRDIIRLTDELLSLCQSRGQTTAAPDAEAEADQRIRALVVKISARFPERAKMESALTQLVNLHDEEVYKGFRATMNAENTARSVRKHQKSAFKRLVSLAPGIVDTIAPLWKCVGLTFINRGLVPYLFEFTSSDSSMSMAVDRSATLSQTSLKSAAGDLLDFITKVFPEMLKHSSDELFSIDELRSESALEVEERMALMVKYAKAVPHSVPKSTALESQLAQFVRAGTSIRQAKYAAFLITQTTGTNELSLALTGDMVDNLDNRHLDQRAPSYAALSRLVQYAPSAFVGYADRVSTFLIQSVLMDNSLGSDAVASGSDEDDSSDEWLSRSQLEDSVLCKIYAVKILANWLMGMDRQSLTRDRVQLVLGTLRQLVRNGGEMQQDTATSPQTRQHLQLTAASCMLKLASLVHFDHVLNAADISSLALVVQAPCYEVRSTFLLKKLIPALVSWKISVRFVPALFMVAHDPEAALRDNVKHAVELRLASIRPTPGSPSVIEESLCRLLFILAHHPDWDDSRIADTLELFCRYIEFFIACVCVAQNVSLLFCYAGEIKAYKNRKTADALSKDTPNDTFTNRLYILSELTQFLLREKSTSSNWPVNVYPGKLTLPSDIFEPLSDASESSAVRGQPYLDPEFIRRRAKAPTAAHKRSRARPAEPSGSSGQQSKRNRNAAVSRDSKAFAGAGKGKQAAARNGNGSDEEDDAEGTDDSDNGGDIQMDSDDDDDDEDEQVNVADDVEMPSEL